MRIKAGTMVREYFIDLVLIFPWIAVLVDDTNIIRYNIKTYNLGIIIRYNIKMSKL